MEKVELGKTGIFVTPVGMGVLTIGRTQLDLPLATGAAIVRHALKQGINFLDTAELYETYPYIRAALDGTDMKPVIASKSQAKTYDKMKKSIEDMRLALDLDVIDIFLMHEVREAPDFESREGAWACLNEYKAKKIIKAIGLSTHYTDVAEMNAALPESDLLFALINKESLGIRTGKGFGTKEAMVAAIQRNADRGKGVFAMKAFGGGNLIGSYLECLDYVNGIPGINSIMVGISSNEDIDRLVEYAEGRLPRGYMPDLKEKKIRIDQWDCEGCGACREICPNKAIFRQSNGIMNVNHAQCLTCGYCAPVCPVRAIILY
ncbi:MAG: aldo/keto reductase [Clostridiales Family XIII bacterium]|jgi:predicted aldo/keto reductase-like oxidoreductase|nr:aldo/keto reductase [Clostridiales Family XIII bacterium]